MERVNLPSKILLSKLIFLARELFSQDRCQMKRVKSYCILFCSRSTADTPHAVLESPQLQDAPCETITRQEIMLHRQGSAVS